MRLNRLMANVSNCSAKYLWGIGETFPSGIA